MADETKRNFDKLPLLISANQMPESNSPITMDGSNNLQLRRKNNGSVCNSSMKLVQTNSGNKILLENAMSNSSMKNPIIFIRSDVNQVVKTSSIVSSNASINNSILRTNSDANPVVKTSSAFHPSLIAYTSSASAFQTSLTYAIRPVATSTPTLILKSSSTNPVKPFTATVSNTSSSINIPNSALKLVTTTEVRPTMAAVVRPGNVSDERQKNIAMPLNNTALNSLKPVIAANAPRTITLPQSLGSRPMLLQIPGQRLPILILNKSKMPALVPSSNIINNAAKISYSPAPPKKEKFIENNELLLNTSNTIKEANKSSITQTNNNSSIQNVTQNLSRGIVYIKNDGNSFRVVGKPVPIKLSNTNNQCHANNPMSVFKNASSESLANYVQVSNTNRTILTCKVPSNCGQSVNNMKMDQNKCKDKGHREQTNSSEPPDYLAIQIKQESCESPFNDKYPKVEVTTGIVEVKEEFLDKNYDKLEVTTGILDSSDIVDEIKIKEDLEPFEKEMNDNIVFDKLQPIASIKEEPQDEDLNNDLLAQDEQLRQLFSNRDNNENTKEIFLKDNCNKRNGPMQVKCSDGKSEPKLNVSAASEIIKRLDANINPDKKKVKAAKFFIRTSDGKLVSISPSEAKVLGLDLSKDVEVNRKKLEHALKYTKPAGFESPQEILNRENQLNCVKGIVKIPENANINNYVNMNLPPELKDKADLFRKAKHLGGIPENADINNYVNMNLPSELKDKADSFRNSKHLGGIMGKNTKSPLSSKNATKVLSEFSEFVQNGKKYFRIYIEDEENEKDTCDIEITIFNKYICPYCIKEFKTKDHIISHIRIHTGERPYPCEVCGKRYRQRIDIIRHMRIHTGEKPFECELCDASFNQKSNLRSHMRVHTGERPVQCKICGKGFSRNTHLKQHMKLHTGEKPFKCEVCNRPFRFKSGLQAHSRIHTGAKPYACGYCGRKFTQIVGLIRHEKTHEGEKPFRCKRCGKSFISKETLQVHLKKHTSERPHKCQICSKTFTDVQALRSHSKKYHKSLIICIICLKDDFKTRIELREHLREHERENWEKNAEGNLIPTKKSKKKNISINDTMEDSDNETAEKQNNEIGHQSSLRDFEEHIQVEVELDTDDPMEDDYENDNDLLVNPLS